MRMKRISIVSLVTLATALGAFAGTDVTAMSFNIRYGTANDGKDSWEYRREMVVRMIHRYSPTVMGTQECLDFQADYIVRELPEYRWFGVDRDMDTRGERMAVFYRKDTVAPIETGNFWLSETPDVPGSKSWDASCVRMVTWARFYHIKEKRFFYFVNTHLDHRSAEARVEGSLLLAGRTREIVGDDPVIITGDFNENGGTSQPWTNLTHGGFADAWKEADKRVGPSVTNGQFRAPEQGAHSRIDWIMMAGPIKCRRCETVVYSEKGRFPSDHYPVYAEFDFTG